MAVSGRYFRFRQSAGAHGSAADSRFHLYELAIYESADCSGANLATGRGATAVASSYHSFHFSPDKAFDGSWAENGWAPAWGDQGDTYQWVYVDLGSSKTVRSIKLQFHFPPYIPMAAVVEVSDDKTGWSEIAEISILNSSAVQEFTELQAADPPLGPGGGVCMGGYGL